MHILVVEDEPRLATLLRRGLGEEGYAVTVAVDGEEHRAVMAQLATVLVNAPAREGLAAARTYSDVLGAIALAG